MLRPILKSLLDPICFKVSKKRFEKLNQSLKSQETRLALPFVYRGEGHHRKIAPMQSHQEIARLYSEVCNQSPKVILEIGTCHGGTLYLWCQAATPDATIISLDLPAGKYGGGYHATREKLYKLFATPGQSLHLLRGDSHMPESFKAVQAILKGRPVDFLFIDGDHSYNGVKKDFEQYSPLVRKGGLIAFHDIAPREATTGIDVARFWAEIKHSHNTLEFLNQLPNDRTVGIGVIQS